MGLAGFSTSDLLGAFLGLVLTLLVFSYIFGDNFLFRFVIHVFIGVSAGYAAAIVIYNVVWPQLIAPLFSGGPGLLAALIPLFLSLLVLAKVSTRYSALGIPVMAYLVGVGAAAAVGGAVLGTLFPQIAATMNLFAPAALASGVGIGGRIWQFLISGVMLVGTLATLIYFQFGIVEKKGSAMERPLWLQIIAWIGQIFIAVTFGALFAGVYAAALTALIERWSFIYQFIIELLGSFIGS